MLKDIIYSIREKLNLKTDSKIVKGWVKQFNLPDYYVMVLWKRAICVFLQDGKKGCKPKDKDWPIITNIFKAEVKKYLSKVDEDIKYVIKNPTIHGKKAKIHYDEAREISLKKVIKNYEDELKKCCEKCKSICDS
jgi:hypothetical protein